MNKQPTTVRVVKDGRVFLFRSLTLKDPQAILCAVDHADVHYTLGTEKAVQDLNKNGIVNAADNERHQYTITL